MEGLGALIISPTRELAVQIFEVLQKAGKNHQFAAGLAIGGQPVETEQKVSTTAIETCFVWLIPIFRLL